jgi:hypothetical protein
VAWRLTLLENSLRLLHPISADLTEEQIGPTSRSRLWKAGLQRLANLTGLHLQISHFPPGTSKWNKIEHHMFSFITQKGRARPLVSYQTIILLIANTRTTTGLKIKAKLTQRTYPT